MNRKGTSIRQMKFGNGEEPINNQRRELIGGALGALLVSPWVVEARESRVPPNDPFIVLLKGIYRPVPAGQGPANNLGLTTVNLDDGSYSKTLIYPVFGMAESKEHGTAIGIFYVQFFTGGNLCAYQLPGGAI